MARKLFSLIALTTLTACTPSGSGADLPRESATPAGEPAMPEPVSTEPATTASLPSCEGLVTPTELDSYFFEESSTVELLSPIPNWGSPAAQLADPAFTSLLERADHTEACTWGIPSSDAFFTIIMGAITPPLATEITAEISARGYPEMHPPTRGYAGENPEAGFVSIHLVEPELWLVFQGGEGSIAADDAERHGFASILGRIADEIAP